MLCHKLIKMESTRSRSWFVTVNRFDENTEAHWQETLKCRYIWYCYELAPTTNHPHFHVFVYYEHPKTFSAVCKDFPDANVQISLGGIAGAKGYCEDDKWYQRGIQPMSQEEKGQSEVIRWAEARAAAVAGDFSSIPDDLYTRYQSSYKRMRREDQPPPTDLATQDHYGVWIWGPPGTGKSHKARHEYGEVYLKDLNKWWDDYSGQASILIDEYAPEHSQYLSAFMKKWVDKWKFSAEVKGGRLTIRPQLIIVTSNYSIQECFTGVDLQAMLRRFKVIHVTKVYEPEMSLSSVQTAM